MCSSCLCLCLATKQLGHMHSLTTRLQLDSCSVKQTHSAITSISDTVLTSVWVLCVCICCVGVCHPHKGAEHMPRAAAGERGGNIWAESRKEQHQGMCVYVCACVSLRACVCLTLMKTNNVSGISILFGHAYIGVCVCVRAVAAVGAPGVSGVSSRT